MVEGVDAGWFCPALFCKTLSPLLDLSFPTCTMKGPSYSYAGFQCQENFPLTGCFGQAVLATVL